MSLDKFKKNKKQSKQHILTGAVSKEQYEFVKANEISISKLLKIIIQDLINKQDKPK